MYTNNTHKNYIKSSFLFYGFRERVFTPDMFRIKDISETGVIPLLYEYKKKPLHKVSE